MTTNCLTCLNWDSEYTKLGLGECKAVLQLWDSTEWDDDGFSIVLTESAKDAMAFVQDGSDYRANLYTKPDFYCAQFIEKPHQY